MHAKANRKRKENFNIKNIAKDVGKGIKKGGQTVGGGIKKGGQTVGGGLKKGLGGVGGFFKGIGGFFKNMWNFLGYLKWILLCCCCCCCILAVYMVSAPFRILLTPIMGALSSIRDVQGATSTPSVTPGITTSYFTRGIAGAVGKST
jgi:hypothetical protein